MQAVALAAAVQAELALQEQQAVQGQALAALAEEHQQENLLALLVAVAVQVLQERLVQQAE